MVTAGERRNWRRQKKEILDSYDKCAGKTVEIEDLYKRISADTGIEQHKVSEFLKKYFRTG